MLHVLDVVGKWSLIDVYVMIVLMVTLGVRITYKADLALALRGAESWRCSVTADELERKT